MSVCLSVSQLVMVCGKYDYLDCYMGFKERWINFFDKFYIEWWYFMNFPRTYKKLHCKGEPFGSVVTEILWYKQTDIMLLLFFDL